MKISINWLKEYISFDLSPAELAERLTMVGLEVEDISSLKIDIKGVVVGDVVDIQKHPSADKLMLCKVNVGEKVLQIICGAPNVAKNQRVPVATIGTTLSDHLTIEAKAIRGIQSEGMICSERELGISDNHAGILVLDKKKYAIGDPFPNSQTVTDTVLDINVTPNRPDCLSHLGIAREIGVITGNKLRKPTDRVDEINLKIEDCVKVDIKDNHACPRYSVRIIRDVEIGSSPDWLKVRLENVGLRSINNVVDITNYVMYETGHPLHAFDYDLVQDHRIVVRKAKEKETFITLNEEEHTLSKDDLLICDGKQGIALAGIMGGLNSEVSDQTKHILLESAYFDPVSIRKTSKKLGLNTDASQRFERGADPNNTIYAVNRAAKLFTEIAGGKVIKGITDIFPLNIKPKKISLSRENTNKILGMEIPPKKIFSILRGLDLELADGEPIQVTVPTHRPDLNHEIDLIEEIIRHYGYHKIPSNLYSRIGLSHQLNKEDQLTEHVKDILIGFGFFETVTNSLVDETHISSFNPEKKSVAVKNPLSPETAFMRTMLIPSLLDIVQWNKNRSQHNLRLFEIGRVFTAKAGSLPDEMLCVAGVISGSTRIRPFWNEQNMKFNLFHLKGFICSLFEHLHIAGMHFQSEDHRGFQSYSSQSILCRGTRIGMSGEIDSTILNEWDIRDPVFGFEMSVPKISKLLSKTIKYRLIPKFPSINRDLSVVVDENITASELEELILKNAGNMLIQIELFDLYKGQQIPEGKKSLSFSMTFQSPSRTLKEEDVDPYMVSIVDALEKNLGASLRS